MDLQKTILKQYMLLNNNPTLKAISKDTGIQTTRVFRLFNGSTMKLSEYQIFQKKVKMAMGLNESLESLAFDCSLKFHPSAIKEIEVFLTRKLEVWRFCQSSNTTSIKTQELSA